VRPEFSESLSVLKAVYEKMEKSPPPQKPLSSPQPPLKSEIQTTREYSKIEKPVKIFGKYGSGPGEFNALAGICLARLRDGSIGELLVCDTYNYRIQVLDRETGEFIHSFVLQNKEMPWSIAVIDYPPQRGKRIYVSVSEGNIQVFNGGNFSFLYSSTDPTHKRSEIHHLATNSVGNILVSYGEFESSCVKIFKGETNPARFSDNPVEVFQILSIIGSPIDSTLFRCPRGMAGNSKGHIIVVESFLNNIQIFDSLENGCKFIKIFGEKGHKPGQFSSPSRIAVDSQNNILVVDRGNQKIQIFSENGDFLHTFGKKGKKEGEFSYPQGIAVDHQTGLIYIADQYNHRIQVF